MKVKQIIKIAEWENGRGYNWEIRGKKEILEVTEEEIRQEQIDWSWWEIGKEQTDKDIQITVIWCDPDDEEIRYNVWTTWESDLRE